LKCAFYYLRIENAKGYVFDRRVFIYYLCIENAEGNVLIAAYLFVWVLFA